MSESEHHVSKLAWVAELPPVLATTMPSLSLLALPFNMLSPYYPLSLVYFPLPLLIPSPPRLALGAY